jgi:DUF1009 family protein
VADDRVDSGMPDLGLLAVVIGACGYSNQISQKMRTRRFPYRLYSWLKHFEGRDHIDLFNLDEGLKRFAEDGVTHVLNAGTVDINLLKFMLESDPGRSPAEIEGFRRMIRQPTEFYALYAEKLKALNITVISARDIFDNYHLPKDVIGHHKPNERILGWLEALKAQAIRHCSRKPFRYISQSAVFDDHEMIAIEYSGTDAMLRRLGPKPEGVTRFLIKVQPENFPAKIDEPTIGPKTIEVARAAHVDVIGIDAQYGLIIDRAETLALADQAGMALVGI